MAKGWKKQARRRRAAAQLDRSARQRRDAQEELIERLRALARWKNNDVVKLAFLDAEDIDQADGLDLSGVAELKRNANGTFEARFVDQVKVLAMLRELLEHRQDGSLQEFMDALRDGEDA